MSLSNKLEIWRKDLIDMSRRNPLLYYKSEGKRPTGIQFLPENPELLFSQLLGKTGSISLDKVPCAIEPEELERRPLGLRLLRLQARIREDERDRGIRTLYMAFGILEWYETPSSQEMIRSPLIFAPVSLNHKAATDTFLLKSLDDIECEINPTLHEKLNHDFKISLPKYSDLLSESDTAPPSLTDLLSAIQDTLPGDGRWKILPEAHLGRFAFQKLVMYQDLQQHSVDILAHPLLQVVGGDAPRPPLPPDLPSADDFDDRIPPQHTLEILDADSSQQEAILLAKSDVSFVLQGPPGTGKSQTIANIIAERLGQGKKVLFVSEKMAALEVVRKRLQDAGLGDYCLDLHSSRTNAAQKIDFFNALKLSLDDAVLPPDAPSEDAWQRQSMDLQRHRAELNSYVKELHLKRLPLGRSAFDAYAELASLIDAPDLAFSVPNIDAVTADQFGAMTHAIEQLSTWHEVLAAYDSYPWRESRATSYSLELESDIRAHFNKLSTHLRALSASLTTMLALLGENATANIAWLPYAVERAEAALTSPQPARSWLSGEALTRLRTLAEDMLERSRGYKDDLSEFLLIYNRTMLVEDLKGLRETLTEKSAWAVGCLRDQRESSYDTALALRPELERQLTAAIESLTLIPSAAGALTDMSAVDLPETLAETSALITLARHLQQTPMPPSSWLNPSTCVVARILTAEAQERYAQCAQMRNMLESMYQPGFFALDLPSMAERFRTQYAPFFRNFQLSFHRDIRLVRSLLAPGQMRTAAQIETDLYLAAKLLDLEASLDAKRIEYAQALDRYFDGPQTDWEKVTTALRWVTQFHVLMAGAPMSPAMAALITGPAKALRPVSAALDRLADVYTRWEQVEGFCLANLHVSSVLQQNLTFDDVTPPQAQAALNRLLGDLRIFWKAVDTTQSHRHAIQTAVALQQPLLTAHLLTDLERTQRIHAFETDLTEKSEVYVGEFGHFFQGTATDWQTVIEAISWTERFLKLYVNRAMPEAAMSLIAYPVEATNRDILADSLTTLRQALPLMNEELRYSDTVLARSALSMPGKTFGASALSDIADRVDDHIQHLPELKKWLTCQERLDACRRTGQDNFIEGILRQRPIPQDLGAIFKRRFYSLWLDGVRRLAPALAQFRDAEHAQTIEQFRNLDASHKILARKRLNAILRERRRQVFGGTLDNPRADFAHAANTLRREAQKKRRSAIRVAVRKTAPALLELKPCWMMSPLSVSQFLETGAQLFDLVIFDEASQVCPEDSISSILRGKQLIVVGDPKQLPPTRFFSKSLADVSGADDEESEEEETEERTQSILDECLSAAFVVRSLQWHYRSADESLIAFSNHHYYGGDLVTFPSAERGLDRGVRFIYVENSNYRAGRNKNEAERVADIIFDYLRAHVEDRSLGVVALSAAQQDAIMDALDNRMKRNPELSIYREDLLSSDNPSGIFIKNLESVQGDERDTIILSVGYGPDANGNISHRFGPVNHAGGERRLNVAVTRARKQMIVVSSMKADKLPSTLTSQGAKTLRYCLEYAEKCSESGAQRGAEALAQQAVSGSGHAVSVSEDQFDSPFEEAVYKALTARGLLLDTQVGCSRYRIDMAVRDPAHPGNYLLGIECDGRTYHSSRTARDRDRLRQAQLEDMGWKLHRIWSSDWFAQPTTETLRVLTVVEDIVKLRSVADTSNGSVHETTGNAAGLTQYTPGENEDNPDDLAKPQPASRASRSTIDGVDAGRKQK